MLLDHVVVNVRDGLHVAARRYEALGFTLTAPSRHTLGSMNRLALFADHYVELLGIDPEAAEPRAELLSSPAGLNAIVFATEDAAGLHRELRARGVPVGEPMEFSRPILGAGEARFRTVHVASGAVPYGRLYFCQHLTRDLVWGAASHEHANGAVAVASIAIDVRDPGAAAGLYRQLFGAAAVREDKGFVVGLGPVRIELSKAARDRIATLTFATRSLAQTRRALAAERFSDVGNRLVSRETESDGLLEFVAADARRS
jgi:hypothetical protein